MKPKLTEEASEVIATEYSKLRSEESVESHVARVCASSYFLNQFFPCIVTFNSYYSLLDSTSNSSYPGNTDSVVHRSREGSFVKECYR